MSVIQWFKNLFSRKQVAPAPSATQPEPVVSASVAPPSQGLYGAPIPGRETTPAILGQLDAWYRACVILPKHKAEVERVCARIKRDMSRYDAVGKHFDIPGYVVALLHNMEAGGDFAGVLHNGEKIIGTGRKTALVPAGRGPFNTWEESAIDALSIKPTKQRLGKCTPAEVLWYAERFNGLGPRNAQHNRTAYCWSMTDVYSGGKYIADHRFDPHAWSAQVGVAALMKGLGIS